MVLRQEVVDQQYLKQGFNEEFYQPLDRPDLIFADNPGKTPRRICPGIDMVLLEKGTLLAPSVSEDAP